MCIIIILEKSLPWNLCEYLYGDVEQHYIL